MPRGTAAALCVAALAWCAFAPAVPTAPRAGAPRASAATPAASLALGVEGCLHCHDGIEDMHPWQALTCVECHGGDASATTKETAHVLPLRAPAPDERLATQDDDPAWRRFVNPTDLRIVQKTCARCHAAACSDVRKSLHATTAGHLSDGLYENGVVAKRSTFAIFPTVDDDGVVAPHALKELKQVGGFAPGPADKIATHYRDVPRKNCMQCHLWSRGRAVRGRLGMDGDYRGEGCAACHVTYSDRGFSESADRSVDRKEPGHPLKHEMTARVPTSTCTRCHYGDASIGLSFRGLAQLVPGQPAGPDVPGTTAQRQNGAFYLRDDRICPPDLHHERGMQCVDCHTRRDVMGDGDLQPNMDRDVEVSCTTCHGTFAARADGRTNAGNRLKSLVVEGPNVRLATDGGTKRRRVKQARDVVDPFAPDFDARAREAMTPEHAKLACYACHAGWNPNFFGFHFDRNESFTQLDLLSGERTPGRVNTQEKVFATFKQLALGLDDEGRFAPYLVGFSTFCSAYDKSGANVVDHAMPRTGGGLSGMTMIHHQPHTTRPEARQCAECHRAGAALGLGAGSFSLAGGVGLAATTRGVATFAVDRKAPDVPAPLAEARFGLAHDVALVVDPVTGLADVAYAATDAGLVAIDLANPAFPTVIGTTATPGVPRRLLATDRYLYAAAEKNGVFVFDLKERRSPKLAGRLGVTDARALASAGLRLFVADGAKGFAVADVKDPAHPEIAGYLPFQPAKKGGVALAQEVAVHFQFSRPLAGGGRTRARQIAAVGGAGIGLRLVDVTEPSKPRAMWTVYGEAEKKKDPSTEIAGGRRVVGLAFTTKFDLGSTGGGIPSYEHDDLLVATVGEGGENRLWVVRTTDPERPEIVDRVKLDAAPLGVLPLKLYNAPFLVHAALVPTTRGVMVVDLTRTGQAVVKGLVPAAGSGGVAAEAMPFDRMITEEGVALKDVAHDDARYVNAAELRRILFAPIPDPADEPAATRPAKEEK